MILTSFDLSRRVALVTGANHGPGQGVAPGLAEADANVVGVSHGACHATGAAVAVLGRRSMPLPCDPNAATPADLERLVGDTIAAFGTLDILVKAAGTAIRHSVLDYPLGGLDAGREREPQQLHVPISGGRQAHGGSRRWQNRQRCLCAILPGRHFGGPVCSTGACRRRGHPCDG